VEAVLAHHNMLWQHLQCYRNMLTDVMSYWKLGE